MPTSVSADTFDLFVLALLVTFLVWGWWRGFLGQFVALVLALLALELANALGPSLEPVVRQIAAPGEAALPGLAWASAFALLLVGFHVALRAFGLVRPSPAFPRLISRIGGALLAGLRGALLLLLASYVFLQAVVEPAAAQRLGAESHALARMPRARRRLTALLRLSEPIQRQARDIEGWIPHGR